MVTQNKDNVAEMKSEYHTATVVAPTGSFRFLGQRKERVGGLRGRAKDEHQMAAAGVLAG